MDETPPGLLATDPEPGSLGVDRNITIRIGFDEDVKFRRRKAPIHLLPGHKPVRVKVGWDFIEIRPEGALAADCTYCVLFTETPEDLRGNRMPESPDICFSTGDSLHTGRISGIVEVPEGTVGDVVLEAIHLPDSLRYRTVVSPEGGYELQHLPRGEWWFRAFVDVRRDGGYDPPTDTGVVREGTLREQHLELDFGLTAPGEGGP